MIDLSASWKPVNGNCLFICCCLPHSLVLINSFSGGAVLDFCQVSLLPLCEQSLFFQNDCSTSSLAFFLWHSITWIERSRKPELLKKILGITLLVCQCLAFESQNWRDVISFQWANFIINVTLDVFKTRNDSFAEFWRSFKETPAIRWFALNLE